MRLDKSNREIYDLKASSDEFVKYLLYEFNWFTGVADSVYRNVLPLLPNYHFAPRENHAVSMAFGARLAGLKPAILMQNSGLGLCIDSILGTFNLYHEGCVIFVSNRGRLRWEEIQHKDWGKITEDMLSSLEIPFFSFDNFGLPCIKDASKVAFEDNKVSVVLIDRGNINE